MPGSDVKVISVAVLCEAPRNGSFVRFQSPGAKSTHWRVLTTVVLSGNGKDLLFPMEAPCLFFT